MVVAGFILVYRSQWHQVWIVSWIVTFVFVTLPALYLLLPARIHVRVDRFFERIGDALDCRKAAARRRASPQYNHSASSSSLSSPSSKALGLPKVAPS
jgi:hypothetical protein